MMGTRVLHLQRLLQTLGALQEALMVAWNEIPQDDIDHLIRGEPRCFRECVIEHFLYHFYSKTWSNDTLQGMRIIVYACILHKILNSNSNK